MAEKEVSPVFCTGSKVERREDGMVVTFYKAEGGSIERYMTFQEFFEFSDQLKAMLANE